MLCRIIVAKWDNSKSKEGSKCKIVDFEQNLLLYGILNGLLSVCEGKWKSNKHARCKPHVGVTRDTIKAKLGSKTQNRQYWGK